MDLAHLSHQLADVILLLAHLCLLFILSSVVAADHLIPYHGTKTYVSSAKDHTRSEVFGLFLPLLEHLGGETNLHLHIFGRMLPSALILALGGLKQRQEIVCGLTGVV